jgi:methylated-DNA-protein-cysteine methyltransferase-like protein
MYALVRQIPAGRVATYGQIGRIAGCGARMAGYAMAAVPKGSEIPWHRVINSQGRISARSIKSGGGQGKSGGGEARQRKLLRAEGVAFDPKGRIDLEAAGWSGPGWEWLEAHGYDPARI